MKKLISVVCMLCLSMISAVSVYAAEGVANAIINLGILGTLFSVSVAGITFIIKNSLFVLF